MRRYKKEEVVTIYEGLVKEAKSKACSSPEKALRCIEIAAEWAYSFNFCFADLELESLVKEIADRELNTVWQQPRNNSCVMIDSFCKDNRGLTQQYLRAIIKNDYDLLYICTRNKGEYGNDIVTELKSYKNVKFLFYSPQGNSRIGVAQQVVNEIESFRPLLIFLHLTPMDTIALMACHKVSGVVKYNINLTDHAFWMGSTFVDYNIEFSPYGKTISLEKRGFQETQLLELPYYPITPISDSFKGFPEMPKNSVTVFTGGALQKMLGGNDIFFKIMERVLSTSENVYILVAGFEKNEVFDEKIQRINGNERIIQIGRRHDIDAVFEHINIYLSTWPAPGGLMSQYAAKHGKPIIAFCNKNSKVKVETFVNHFQTHFHSFDDLDELQEYTRKLVSDVPYRTEEGEILRDGIMTEERFVNAFNKVINHQEKICDFEKLQLNYEGIYNYYLDIEYNNGGKATQSLVVKKPSIILMNNVNRLILIEGLWKFAKGASLRFLLSRFGVLFITVVKRLFKIKK